MSYKELKQSIQQAYTSFLNNRGLKPRYGQKVMIAEVAKTLINQAESSPKICVIEAGTGTGKTIAYLLSAVPIALYENKKIIISTATVALQEQLLFKDLPQLVSDAGIDLSYGIAKGRGRYFCLLHASQALSQQKNPTQAALYEDEIANILPEDDINLIEFLADSYINNKWDGDRDTLEITPKEKLWNRITSNHANCNNNKCEFFSGCPFFQARQRMEEWDLVISNHDLVLADLSLGGGIVLSEPEKTIYIFDEGHHLGTKARNHFSASIRLKLDRKMLATTANNLKRLLKETNKKTSLYKYIEQLIIGISDIDSIIKDWQQVLKPLQQQLIAGSTDVYRFVEGKIPKEIQEVCHQFSLVAALVRNKSLQIADIFKEALEDKTDDLTKAVAEIWYPKINSFQTQIESMLKLANSYAVIDQAGVAPTARWLRRVDTSAGLDIECNSSPISSASMLADKLWARCHAAIITSATLTALGSFEQLYADLGIPEQSKSASFGSPFDYTRVAELRLPLMKTDPSHKNSYDTEVAEIIKKIIPEDNAILVLFSSWRQMRYVIEQMPDKIKDLALIQGELAKHEILKLHHERIDAGKTSVIFGLASFAEGVDLPGKYLTHVIITRLPFSVPDDPVDKTYTEWIESQGHNSFQQWVVPMASMRLTQATGRLLRTEQDTGVITLLDRRLITKYYGKKLLAALPPYRQNFSWEAKS